MTGNLLLDSNMSWIIRWISVKITIILLTQQCCEGFIVSPSLHLRYQTPWHHQVCSQQFLSRYKYKTIINISNDDGYDNNNVKPLSTIEGYISDEQENKLKQRLIDAGFQYISSSGSHKYSLDNEKIKIYSYRYIKASGMLRLVEGSGLGDSQVGDDNAPRWIPVQKGEEKVLVANGWSFLDPDESEPLSAFDIDAANKEGQYVPKWGIGQFVDNSENDEYRLSSLGFNIRRMSKDEILQEANTLVSASAKSVLLNGETDIPNTKITNNGFDFSGSVRDEDIVHGLFVCAIGGLPLFTTCDLSPSTASSGWLSFSKPLVDDHITLIYPDQESVDKRIEVICAKSGCHLGHYFGKGEGYCINASALNFIPCDGNLNNGKWNALTNPISWHKLNSLHHSEMTSSQRIALQVILCNIPMKEVCLGAGCFWHVEHALHHLPGMVDTTVGYSGGTTISPSYGEVCDGRTNHAEVVLCKFDPTVLDPRKLFNCFLAMHDPTNIRSHGKRARKSGQYRSCVFVYDKEMESMANEAVADCTKELMKLLSTEVEYHSSKDLFWIAESHHQQHDQRLKSVDDDGLRTLTFTQWLQEYGRRGPSIWGSSKTIKVAFDEGNDDGMARMMI